ncbi:hypothetical protein FRB94_009594 [Tulasnella sp. JGI-2019a]|nr:hypothetical protein FRB93_012649 [Tulasnella sp. JGI-2019a]KAG9010892.1 hypothetical protein FRB94_009594 [Tulasnella sp. JGI-2019a]KAG9037737.1 hypothetical protein FRB95_004583 [Tulasnella sp. JGI-2019a]
MRASALLYPLAATYVLVPTLAAPTPIQLAPDWHSESTNGLLKKRSLPAHPKHRLEKRLKLGPTALKILVTLLAGFTGGVAWSAGDHASKEVLQLPVTSMAAKRDLSFQIRPHQYVDAHQEDPKSALEDDEPTESEENNDDGNTEQDEKLSMDDLVHPSPEQQRKNMEVLANLDDSDIKEAAHQLTDGLLSHLEEHPEVATDLSAAHEVAPGMTPSQMDQLDSMSPDEQVNVLNALFEVMIGLQKTRALEMLASSPSAKRHTLHARSPLIRPPHPGLYRIAWKSPQFWKETGLEAYRNIRIGAVFVAGIGLLTAAIGWLTQKKGDPMVAANSTAITEALALNSTGDQSVDNAITDTPAPAAEKRSLIVVDRRMIWKAVIGGLAMGLGGTLFIKAIQGHPALEKLFPGMTKRSLPAEAEVGVRDRNLQKRGKILSLSLIISGLASAYAGSYVYDYIFKPRNATQRIVVPVPKPQRRSVRIDELVSNLTGDSSKRELD